MSMFTTSFLDPNHEAPAEFASASNENEGTRFPRPLGGWTGSYFKKISLGDLGLIIQLGHKLGKICQIPAVVRSFVVIDVDGIHTVQISFCECMRNVETAATFHILNLFQVLSFMSKVSAYEFYHTLARLSDNTGLHLPPPGCIEGTQPGELALRCPACPHPHVNLPDGWEKRWLYRLFVTVDANFRLRCLNVSDELNDPSLNQGYAYFVEEQGFKAYLKEYGDIIPEEEKSTCNNHDAVKLANSRGGKGAAATGVGAVVCGRHDMKRPLSVGDLQKGERYLNMDYFILSMLTCDTPPDLVISYDIACQWHKNFFVRMGKYPAQLRLHQTEGNILYLVPKFHLPAHILKCRNDFSFNFSAKVGRTDGEAPEQGWAATNALANSMKEMGPGSRRDTLDDHFGDYNWRKIVILASIICEKYKDAVAARAQHVAEFISYEDALWVEHLTAVNQWRSMVLAWESDRTKPNLFSPTLRPVTENAVRLELAREEKTENSIEIHHDLEEAHSSKHCAEQNRTRIQQQANRISRKVDAWSEIQKVYMPKTSLLRVETHPTKIPLYLPSTALRLDAVDPSPKNTIINDERCLRLAQAHDTLAMLHDHLLLKSYLMIWHQRFSRGQRYGTRANTLMHRVETKISADAARYRRTYAALDVVSTYLRQHEWKKDLFPLRPEDISGLNSNNNLRSEGHRLLSWIWKTNIQGGEEGLQEALCIEWCKSRTRAQRWQEECELLVEEIRRVKVTFQFYEKVWKDRAERVDLSGARAYTLKQAALWQELEKSAAKQWSSTLMSLPLLPHEVPDPTLNLDSP
ncbi:hypothetical protein EDD18DRAFT_1307212 [Armillaria luteobubalina]|uniref:CxC2-like cysteine cluster KDZ transposase-associated domain-containing protein n=1 Tax=Armillaria luteobubalina TaxID=153913 RepID=A0AA39QF70_9AGAR|nr:hypothetical protein EDD18DRAFT_1307212 [Armillaria luteobubalina]